MREIPVNNKGHGSKWVATLAVSCILLLVVSILLPRQNGGNDSTHANTPSDAAAARPTGPNLAKLPSPARPANVSSNAATAEEIVSEKVKQFGRNRREIVRGISQRLGKDMPSCIEEFFDAIESGDWERIDALWKVMAKHSGQYVKKDSDSAHWPELDPYWPAVLDAYGVAEQAHLWPAQNLLDYGNAILDSLRPGMVYAGGTDSGRWIPELINETSGSEPHIIVTQNAFADARYLEYMNTLYGDRFNTLTMEDSQKAFQSYVADAQKRLMHDQQFPDEPKQLPPGENVTNDEGKVQVSGQVAVMAINEKLLQTLMEKNPEMSFAIEQSFAFKSTYGDATPLGPVMELRAGEDNSLTAERATQSSDYWSKTVQQLLNDPEIPMDSDPRKAYAKLAVEQAALLLNRSFPEQAEKIYQYSLQLSPVAGEAVFGYAQLLIDQNRMAEALQIAQTAANTSPEKKEFGDLAAKIKTYIASPSPELLPRAEIVAPGWSEGTITAKPK